MLKRTTCYGLCALVIAALLLQGCMGFGGGQKIVDKRVKGDVAGPKTLDGWDNYVWPAYNGPKKRVAIGVVRAKAVHPGLAQLKAGISAELSALLLASNRFRVMERGEDEMKGTLDEQDMGAAGLTYGKSAPKAGRLIGAAYAIDATLVEAKDNAGGGALGGIGASSDGKFGGFTIGGKRCEVTINIKIRDTQTGEVLASITGEGYDAKASVGITSVTVGANRVDAGGFGSYANTSIGRAAKRAVAEAVLSVVNTLGKKKWKGTVVSVEGDDRITLAGGTDANLNTGMRMNVHHKVKEIIHPTTGESLGFDTKQVATVVIKRVLEKASFAELESGSLEDVEADDFLEMIEAAPAPEAGGQGL